MATWATALSLLCVHLSFPIEIYQPDCVPSRDLLLGFRSSQMLTGLKRDLRDHKSNGSHRTGGLFYLRCLLTGQTLLALLVLGSIPFDSDPVL